MWDAMKLGKVRGLRLGFSGLLCDAGRAGPRRLVVISLVSLGVVTLVVALTLGGDHKPQFSFDARMKQVDALPGGLHSTPEQDALAYRADTAQAQAAQVRGTSYTTPIAPSVAFQAAVPKAEEPVPGGVVAGPPQPRFVGRPARVYPAAVVIPLPALQPTPAVATVGPPPGITVAQQQSSDPQQRLYNQQVKELFNQWDPRPPRTDIVLQPAETGKSVSAADEADPPSTASRTPRAPECRFRRKPATYSNLMSATVPI